MISRVVMMLLFWHYQKLAELDPGVKIRKIFDSPQIINDKVFVYISYLLDNIYQYINTINDFLQ